MPRPEVGLIVKLRPGSGHWLDELGRNWTRRRALRPARLRRLRDRRRRRRPAVESATLRRASAPSSSTWPSTRSTGSVYVTNTEARNEVRFEGPGDRRRHAVRGHLHESRITVIDGASGAAAAPPEQAHRLRPCVPSPPASKERQPRDAARMAVTRRRRDALRGRLRLGAVGVFDARRSRPTRFVPDADDHIAVSGGGPSGLVLDEARRPPLRADPLRQRGSRWSTRATSAAEIAHVPLLRPRAAERRRRDGRFLYDARRTSSNGEASCASCHVFGDFDSLAWDLGNPDDAVRRRIPNPSGSIGERARRSTR